MYIGIIYKAIKWADDPEPDRLVCIVKDPDPKKIGLYMRIRIPVNEKKKG